MTEQDRNDEVRGLLLQAMEDVGYDVGEIDKATFDAAAARMRADMRSMVATAGNEPPRARRLHAVAVDRATLAEAVRGERRTLLDAWIGQEPGDVLLMAYTPLREEDEKPDLNRRLIHVSRIGTVERVPSVDAAVVVSLLDPVAADYAGAMLQVGRAASIRPQGHKSVDDMSSVWKVVERALEERRYDLGPPVGADDVGGIG